MNEMVFTFFVVIRTERQFSVCDNRLKIFVEGKYFSCILLRVWSLPASSADHQRS